jgi:hypothetical protein
MTIRGTPAFSDISTYTGRSVSILLRCLPFLAKVSTLQIQEGNTRTPVVQIPILRTPDRMQYRRRMIYRLAWSIVYFTTTTAPQENRPTYIGNYLCLTWNALCSPMHADPLVYMRSLTHNVASTCTHQHRLSVYTFVDCRCIITHSLRARGKPQHPVLPIYDAPLDQERAIKNQINKGPE